MDKNYDKYVGRNVILTIWDGRIQNVKVIKNNKEKKWLEVKGIYDIGGIHYLTYANIGEGCAVININFTG